MVAGLESELQERVEDAGGTVPMIETSQSVNHPHSNVRTHYSRDGTRDNLERSA